jgi:hypothetical protein
MVRQHDSPLCTSGASEPVTGHAKLDENLVVDVTKPISDELRNELRTIALFMQLAGKRGGIGHQMPISQVAYMVLRPVRGFARSNLDPTSTKYLREIGQILQAVADGHDANKLFHQHERTKPSKWEENLFER